MFDDNNEYIDYDRLVDDADDLLDEDYYSGGDDETSKMMIEDEYNEYMQEYGAYYHNIADELIDD